MKQDSTNPNLISRISKNKTFYTGIYIPPYDTIHNTSLAITLNNESSVCVFILYPGSFSDAYYILKKISFRNIYIFPVSMDFLFLSDIVRLQNELLSLKYECKVIYPNRLEKGMSNLQFQYNYIENNIFNINNSISSIGVQYIGEKNSRHYNIKLYDRNTSIIFTSYLNDELLNEYYNNTSIKEIHLSYNKTIYGGLSYKKILLNDEFKYALPKLICNGFANEFEFKEFQAMPKTKKKTVEVIYL